MESTTTRSDSASPSPSSVCAPLAITPTTLRDPIVHVVVVRDLFVDCWLTHSLLAHSLTAGSLQATTTAPVNDTESGSNAECHQTRALPAVCPWRLETVRAVLLGTHDAQSPLCQLQAQQSVLELIIRGWAWPDVLVNSARLWAKELFIDVVIAEMLEANPGAVTEAKLREGLELNPDGSIKCWNLRRCGLRALPELFGAVCTTGHLVLSDNQLSYLPDSFGSVTVGGDLYLSDNQLSSLPDSFGSITVGGDLVLNYNQLSSLPDSFGSITVVAHLTTPD